MPGSGRGCQIVFGSQRKHSQTNKKSFIKTIYVYLYTDLHVL